MLAAATVVTALIAEILVGSIETFAEKAHLSDFFVAAVIVAIVGNAAEHGGAVVVAHRGNVRSRRDRALPGAQVAVFLIPAVALISWAIEPIALAFRPVEIAALGASAIVVATSSSTGSRAEGHGAALILLYVVVAAAFFYRGQSG